jgi:hypothetical protein
MVKPAYRSPADIAFGDGTQAGVNGESSIVKSEM